MITGSIGMGVCFGIGWLFYHHVAGMLLMLVLLPFWFRLDEDRRTEKDGQKMRIQFQDVMQSMISAMQAGYSLEQAVPYAMEELQRLYRYPTRMGAALQQISIRLGMSETAEQAFTWLAETTGQAEIREFVQVLVTTKRTGGNLIKVMLHTSEQLAMRREVEREIRTVVAGKRLEAGVMCLIPPGILLYLQLAMPALLSPMYHNLKGIMIMTGILLGYGGSCLWVRKILRIEL